MNKYDNGLDSYLLSLVFVDGKPSLEETTFLEVNCDCGAVYATRVSLFPADDGTGHHPASYESIRESEARCHICRLLLNKSNSLIVMYV